VHSVGLCAGGNQTTQTMTALCRGGGWKKRRSSFPRFSPRLLSAFLYFFFGKFRLFLLISAYFKAYFLFIINNKYYYYLILLLFIFLIIFFKKIFDASRTFSPAAAQHFQNNIKG